MVRDITRQEEGSREMGENLMLQIFIEEFTLGKVVLLDSREVAPGVLCMVFLHMLITTANSQKGLLRVCCRYLNSGIEDACSAYDHCHGMVQLSFAAADSAPREFFSPDRLRELESKQEGRQGM